jgi:hypothetical protein
MATSGRLVPHEVRMPNEPKGLSDKISSWLKSEGYPTEFRTANVFRRHKFHAQQGTYVRGDADGPKREIDVLASVTDRAPDYPPGLLRIAYVVECKWSMDKPWVVFTSPTQRMAPSACIAQTIASKLGEAIAWVMAGDEKLHALHTFTTPDEGGFGGRQAFSKGNDPFYAAVQAAVGNCISYVREYDVHHMEGRMPEAGVLAFPIVVVEGDIYRAYFDACNDEVKITPTDNVRCHWKGSPSREFFATVDVVSMKSLDSFVQQRSQELKEVLLPSMQRTYDELKALAETGEINVTRAPRGMVGRPSLMIELAESAASKARVGRLKAASALARTGQRGAKVANTR